MKTLDIRARMFLAAMLPLALISTLLASWALFARYDDVQSAYEQRNRLVSRQIAMASEYGLFAGNRTQLQGLAASALHEADVRWVGIIDRQGLVLASAGNPLDAPALTASLLAAQGHMPRRRLDWVSQPVLASDIALDDLFDGAAEPTVRANRQLGQVVVAFSRQTVDDQKLNLALGGAVIGGLSLLFGMMLALVLSRGVLLPIARISSLVHQIGQADFQQVHAQRAQISPTDPLHDLQVSIHAMSDQIWATRDELQAQVALATQELRDKKEEAEKANLAKSRFLAAASHDLRQPTHALGLFVSRLAQLEHSAQTHALIGNVQASVQALQNLLDGLLDVSRLEAGAVQVNKRPFALAALFDQLAQDLSDAARDKGLALRIRPTGAWVLSDATLVYRILLNLVNNAIRYTEHGGVLVAVRQQRALGLLQIQVWDTGVGIAPEHLLVVFNEFFQVANAARDRTKGLGLGLSIVRRTADLLGHPVTLTSRLGAGTRVSLTLPVIDQPSASEVVFGGEENTLADLQGVCALVVEDDALALAALQSVLQGWGMQVVGVNGTLAALQQVAQGVRPDVIVSDYRLPGDANGIDTIRQLRSALNADVPACLMSGDTDTTLIGQAQAAKLSLLHKPVRPAKLRSLLRRLLVE
ncbi:MAG: hypothetical protein AUK52_03695 [Comamonadaceae bacterium CG2_30_60_41]|nr:MAG: hypothetical protein AUK52_03695 [Comamonadaceae bacterium CG2_30_60_41]